MNDEDYEDLSDLEGEPQELPGRLLDEPGKCSVCGKANCHNGCFHCGQPVCYPETYYPESSTCGGWILDSWHPDAPSENEFWCNLCREEEACPAEEETEYV